MEDLDKNQPKKVLDEGAATKAGGAYEAGNPYGSASPKALDSVELARRDREVFVHGCRNVRNRVSMKETVGGLKTLALILIFILWNLLTYSSFVPNSLAMNLSILLVIAVLLVGTPKHTLFPAVWTRYHQLEDEWAVLAQEWAGHAAGRSVEQFPAASEEFRELTRQARNSLFA